MSADAIPQQARDDYERHLDEGGTADLATWWARYEDCYPATSPLCATCGYWQAVSNDQCEACAESCGTGVA